MKGGFHAETRLATHLDEIRIEAMVARASASKRERDRAFDEIRQLAQVCAELLADVLSSSPGTAQLHQANLNR